MARPVQFPPSTVLALVSRGRAAPARRRVLDVYRAHRYGFSIQHETACPSNRTHYYIRYIIIIITITVWLLRIKRIYYFVSLRKCFSSSSWPPPTRRAVVSFFTRQIGPSLAVVSVGRFKPFDLVVVVVGTDEWTTRVSYTILGRIPSPPHYILIIIILRYILYY